MKSNPKFSEDVVPLSDLKVNPGRVVNQVDRTHRPVLLTSRGRGVAVVQSVKDYETEAEERDFLKAVVQGLVDVEQGRTVSLAEAKKRLGLD
ncbi:MAG TPA: type II toxin-antitoxin system Phd/YefM family antitoxin [Geobacteraceae bacterium]